MKIILLKDVKKQGKAKDILEVKDGYGTFLINKGYAILATNGNINKLKEKNKKEAEEELKNVEKCKNIRNQIEKKSYSFKVKTGAMDKVFGSISPKQICEELNKNGFDIDKKQLKISESISSLGIHNVEIVLHKDVIANIKIELKK